MKPVEVTQLNFRGEDKLALTQPGVIELRKQLRRGRLLVITFPTGRLRFFALTADDGQAFTGDIIKGIKTFDKWLCYPARWYQFWYPGSGITGGLIFILIVTLISLVISLFYEAIR